jgi:hypothetical protein
MRRSTKNKLMLAMLGFNVILLIIVLICITVMMKSCERQVEESNNIHSEISENFENTDTDISYNMSNGETVMIDNSDYIIKPGKTFYLNKGNLVLFLDVTPTEGGTVFSATGKEYHIGKEMTDAAINTIFTMDMTDYKYYNPDKTICIDKYDGLSVDIRDNRNVALKFTGVLNLISSVAGVSSDTSVDTSTMINQSTSTDISLATEVPSTQIGESDIQLPSTAVTTTTVSDIIVDEYTESADRDTEIVSGKLLGDYLNSSYERKTFTITAKYIESCSNSGTKYVDVNTGIEFYAFGEKYPYDKSICNTVTLNVVYRGNEHKFNGLEMGDEYPCFVINNIRKPTHSEVGQ